MWIVKISSYSSRSSHRHNLPTPLSWRELGKRAFPGSCVGACDQIIIQYAALPRLISLLIVFFPSQIPR